MNCSPAQIAENYPGIAKAKTSKPFPNLLALSIMGGAYVALGCVAAHIVSTLIADPGVAKLIYSLLFPVGLSMILVGGGELFTGNCMLPICLVRGDIRLRDVLKNWGTVYLGNFLGGLLIALISVYAMASNPAFNTVAVYVAESKMGYPFLEAFLRGILCNILVCAAVWMSYSTDSPIGKIITTYFPVALFVLCGTEHCVANMYYFSAALIAGGSGLTVPSILLNNLLPVTLGNIVGGGVLFSAGLYFSLFRGHK